MKKIFALMLVVVIVLVGCGSKESAPSDSMMKEESKEMFFGDTTEESAMVMDQAGSTMEAPTEDKEKSSDGGSASENSALQGRKIIKTGYIYMETLDYERTIEAVNQMVIKYNGFTSFSENNNGNLYEGAYYNRRSRFVIKVPSEMFEAMYKEMNTVGNVVNANEGKEDVTSQFVDIESRLRTLEVQEDRLLAILEKSEKLEDVIELENSLQEVRYEIERYTTNLRNLEDLVRFSTLELQIQEVYKETTIEKPAITLGDRITSGLKKTFNELKSSGETFLVFIITQFPYLLIFALVIFGMIKGLTRLSKKKDKKVSHEAIKGKDAEDK